MRKVLALLGLALSLMFVCRAQSKPTSIDEAKQAIVGVWTFERMVIPMPDSITDRAYIRIDRDGNVFDSQKMDGAGVYTIFPADSSYTMRADENGNSADYVILSLTGQQLVIRLGASDLHLVRMSASVNDTLTVPDSAIPHSGNNAGTSYLTDLSTVKEGIVGLWKKEQMVVRPGGFIDHGDLEFDSSGRIFDGNKGEPGMPGNTITYQLASDGQRYFVQINSGQDEAQADKEPDYTILELSPKRLVLACGDELVLYFIRKE